MDERNESLSGKAPEKLEVRAAGLGEVSADLIEQRARELARMDSRTEPNDGDRDRARHELTDKAAPPKAPELTTGAEDLTAWDDPPEAHGRQAPEVLPEDEANIGEVLVEEGVEEADHDQRVAASTPERLSEESSLEKGQ